jgi:hypothetical protein
MSFVSSPAAVAAASKPVSSYSLGMRTAKKIYPDANLWTKCDSLILEGSGRVKHAKMMLNHSEAVDSDIAKAFKKAGAKEIGNGNLQLWITVGLIDQKITGLVKAFFEVAKTQGTDKFSKACEAYAVCVATAGFTVNGLSVSSNSSSTFLSSSQIVDAFSENKKVGLFEMPALLMKGEELYSQ